MNFPGGPQSVDFFPILRLWFALEKLGLSLRKYSREMILPSQVCGLEEQVGIRFKSRPYSSPGPNHGELQ